MLEGVSQVGGCVPSYDHHWQQNSTHGVQNTGVVPKVDDETPVSDLWFLIVIHVCTSFEEVSEKVADD